MQPLEPRKRQSLDGYLNCNPNFFWGGGIWLGTICGPRSFGGACPPEAAPGMRLGVRLNLPEHKKGGRPEPGPDPRLQNEVLNRLCGGRGNIGGRRFVYFRLFDCEPMFDQWYCSRDNQRRSQTLHVTLSPDLVFISGTLSLPPSPPPPTGRVLPWSCPSLPPVLVTATGPIPFCRGRGGRGSGPGLSSKSRLSSNTFCVEC